ncbi:MAG TPA: SCO family protein [Caldilineaceae bacterium]|nr:SCO family protein [Caldilineaceae bacterium]
MDTGQATRSHAAVLLLLALALAGCGQGYQFHGTAYDPPKPAPAIPGVNWSGENFDLAALRGKVVLIFFGYTYCPDACPLTMAELRQMVADMGEAAKQVAVVFVSTDPQRDTPEQLGKYIAAFNPEFYAVHVSETDLPAVQAAYGVFAEKNAETANSPDGYLVDHSGYIYVVDQKGQLRMLFGYSLPKADLLADVKHLLES